jgi:hypothetical protein
MSPRPTHRLSVLLVEDHTHPDSLAPLLTQDGHEVRVVPHDTAFDGPNDSPDVVILDVRATDAVKPLRFPETRKRPLYVALSDEPAEKPGVDLQLHHPAAAERLRSLLRRFRDIVVPETES